MVVAKQIHSIEEFRFRWGNAWLHRDSGFDTILEKRPNNQYTINVLELRNDNPTVIEINAEAFIRDLEKLKIQSWNKKEYLGNYEDGDSWYLSIKYDQVSIWATGGGMGYPRNFQDFLEVLKKHGFPDSIFKSISSKDVKRTKTIDIEDKIYSTYADYHYRN